MSRAAAFFDLDRTLLRGASGPTLSTALREVGVLDGQPIPGESLMFRVFDHLGETRPSMMLAKQGVRFTKGWDREMVARAGRRAARRLVPQIQPYARQLIAEHQAAGRLVVMATTSPAALCEPLGELLGLDGVVSTQYGIDDDRYSGTVDGHYVWGTGKLDAVAEWANGNDVDLELSYAYSDSYYDQPLLGAVGHPVVVNPDPRLRVVALARRWPVRELDVPDGVASIGGIELQDAALAVARPELVPFARFDIDGAEGLPDRGPVIIASNHRSYFDPLAIGFALARKGRPLRFLGKREVFDAPVLGTLARALGGIRVDRGTGSDEPLDAAAEALGAGEVVVILPQGTIPRGRAFFEPALRGRSGVARLAALTGAPVVPMGLWGTEHVWPRSSKVPAIWNIWDPPTVSVRLGPPVPLVGRSAPADTKRVMAAIEALLPDDARANHVPTDDEIAWASPSGTVEGSA